jgi:hypothetical protein
MNYPAASGGGLSPLRELNPGTPRSAGLAYHGRKVAWSLIPLWGIKEAEGLKKCLDTLHQVSRTAGL